MDNVNVYRLSRRYKRRMLLFPALPSLFIIPMGWVAAKDMPPEMSGILAYMPLIIVACVFISIYLKLMRRIREMRLELSPESLRHVSIRRDQSIPWEQVRLLQIQKDPAGQVKHIWLRTNSGITLTLSAFEKLDEIAGYLTLHCRSLRESTPFEKTMLSPKFAWMLNACFLAIIVYMAMVSPDEVKLEWGSVMIALFFIPYVWLFRGNISGRNTQVGFLKPLMGGFLRSLVMTAIIFVVLMISLYFFVHYK